MKCDSIVFVGKIKTPNSVLLIPEGKCAIDFRDVGVGEEDPIKWVYVREMKWWSGDGDPEMRTFSSTEA